MPIGPTPPRETPISAELLPGHKRFTVYARYPDGCIAEVDVDANTMQEAVEWACEYFTNTHEPGFEVLPEYTQERHGLYM